MNANLISTYHTIAKHPIRVLHLAKSLPTTEEHYYYIRNEYPKTRSPIRKSAYFLYLNRFCFNALYRTNKSGYFNVPFGSRTGDFPADAAFRRSAAALSNANIKCCDFQQSIRKARRGDFVYMDPPYVTAERIDRNEYGPDSFSVKDIQRLADCLIMLHNKGARFLVSYCASPDFLDLLPRKVTKRVRVKRHIAALPSNRRMVSEILIDNADVFGSYPN